MTFLPAQLGALRMLRQLWPDTPFVLVGASALRCFLDFRWRVTDDLDISVSVELNELPAGLDRLAGWSADPHTEHRWLAPGNVKVDVVPAGPGLRRAGAVRWPRTGNEMALLGQRLAFEQAREVMLAPDLSIRVAPVPVVCVLKMVAYQDQPQARARDLEDLAHVFDEYVPADDERRFADEIHELGLEFEMVSAYLLGRDIGTLVNNEERAAITSFIAKVRDENDPHGAQARMANRAPVPDAISDAELRLPQVLPA